MTAEISATRHSDFRATMTWGGDTPVNLTGYTVAVVDAGGSSVLTPVATVTNAAAGQIALRIDWNAAETRTNFNVSFRVKISAPNGDDDATDLITVIYK